MPSRHALAHMRSTIFVVVLTMCIGQTSCNLGLTHEALELSSASRQATDCEKSDACGALLLLALGRNSPVLPSKARFVPSTTMLAKSIPRRNALIRTLFSLGIFGVTPRRATAGDSLVQGKKDLKPGLEKSKRPEWLDFYENTIAEIIPRGSIASKEQDLKRAIEVFDAAGKEDGALYGTDSMENILKPYRDGLQTKIKNDIEILRKNSDFAQRLSSNVSSGQIRFFQQVSISVPDMEKEVTFWKEAMSAYVLDTQRVNGVNITTMAYGSASLNTDDGAKFVLRLVESNAANDPIEYVQLGLPEFRLSKVEKYGGKLISGYGWTNLTAPGGLQLRVQVDGPRDPFMFVALRTSNLEKAIKHYEMQGMAAGKEYVGRTLKKVSSFAEFSALLNSGNLLEPFEYPSMYECERDDGSVLMSYGDPSQTTGLLLLPPKRTGLPGSQPQQESPVVGGQYPTLRVLVAPGGSNDMILPSPDGLSMEFLAAN